MKPFEQLTISEWLTYLETRHTQEIQLGLKRVKAVGKILEILKPDVPVFIVAGTNGKGSIVASLEAIYQAAGYQVAAYSSPHLLVFNERIRINQKPISNLELAESFLKVEKSRGDIPLTYFEMATLAALWHFKQKSPDLIILEVGMGGRLDATNIIDADLALISTIDLDHQTFLGETREKIGFEKAGVLRKERPCIFADIHPPESLKIQAGVLGCKSFQLGKDYHFELDNDGVRLFYDGESIFCPAVPANIHIHSITAGILAAILMKKRLPLAPEHLIKGAKQINLAGRLQLIPASHICSVPVLLDVAHNPQSANYLASYLKIYLKDHPHKRIHAIFSALKDKDIQGLITPLLALVDEWYPAQLGGQRAACNAQLASVFSNYGIMESCYGNPLLAFESAQYHAVKGDLILVYGSFYTVAAILPYLTPREG